MTWTWIETTEQDRWHERDAPGSGATSPDGVRLTGERQQTLRGFGGCFNELGYLPLAALPQKAQDEALRDLFDPATCNFGFNRTPVGANDFAATWYSYDETPGDYDLEHFSVEHDEQTLLPFIRGAQRFQPDMELFASPWSPPTWMKSPAVYNHGRLIQTPQNLEAYAHYLVAYIKAYAERGVHIDQLHVQNEVFADQKFPSCRWSAEELRVFIRDHLGPLVTREGLDTQVFLGTLNGPEDSSFGPGPTMLIDNYNRFVDYILLDPRARSYIAGIGYQWAGQGAIARTHESWPEIEIVQTESECGDGANTWEYAEYVFHLVQHYLRHGATAYTYWNLILDPTRTSTWGWPQNSMLTIDPEAGTVVRNPEYYVMRHYSQAVRRAAVRLGVTGHLSSTTTVAQNPDGTLAVVVQNPLDRPVSFSFEDPQDTSRSFTAELDPRSFHTFVG